MTSQTTYQEYHFEKSVKNLMAQFTENDSKHVERMILILTVLSFRNVTVIQKQAARGPQKISFLFSTQEIK